MRTGPLAVAGWAVAATLTLGVSWSAVQVVRSAVASPGAASSADSLPVPTEPSGTTPATTTPGPTSPGPTTTSPTRPAPTGTPAGRSASESGTGGTVVVRCVGGVAELVRAIPRQGFAVDPDDSSAEVKFTSDSHRTEIKATCVGGEPRFSREEDDRGGGGGDNSGPGGGDD